MFNENHFPHVFLIIHFFLPNSRAAATSAHAAEIGGDANLPPVHGIATAGNGAGTDGGDYHRRKGSDAHTIGTSSSIELSLNSGATDRNARREPRHPTSDGVDAAGKVPAAGEEDDVLRDSSSSDKDIITWQVKVCKE